MKFALQTDMEERLYSQPTPVEASKLINVGPKVPLNGLLKDYAANELMFYQNCAPEEVLAFVLFPVWPSVDR